MLNKFKITVFFESKLKGSNVTFCDIPDIGDPQLTMAMSCLAAGFSTVVTSFRTLESEAWISERSWLLGFVSAIMSCKVNQH